MASKKTTTKKKTIKKEVVKIKEPERLYVESLTSSKKFVIINFSDGSNRTFALVHRGNTVAIEGM